MPELLDVARRIAGAAVAGEQVEACVSWSRDTHVRAYDGDIESLSSAESLGIGVRVVNGNRLGFAYAGSLDEEVAREVLAEARDNATFATEDEHAALADPDGVEPVRLPIWRDELGAFPAARKTELALDLERRTRDGDPRVRQVTEADYEDSAYEMAIASSTGIEATTRRTRCYLSAHLIADDGTGDQTGYSYGAGRSPEELDPATVAADAVHRAVRLLGARKPASSRLPVVLDPGVTATLLGVIGRALSGEDVAKGRSFFAGRIGEPVASSCFALVEDPTDPEAFGAGAIDGEGLACRRVVLVDKGTLAGFLYDTKAARLAGTVSTASAVRGGFRGTPGVGARALAVEPGTAGQDEILRNIGSGLYVQSVHGVHSGVSHVSGDFSVGARGIMISDGAFGEPVREVTIASSLQKMLQDVVAIGGDVERVPSSAMGVTLAIGEMAMSGA